MGRHGGDFRDRRSGRNGAEVFLNPGLGLFGADVADDGEAGIVGSVVLAEKLTDVVETGGLDVLMGADYVGVVGMILGEELMVKLFLDHAIGSVLDGLAALIADDIALVGQAFLIDLAEQVAHAIALEPKGQFELV